MIDILLLAGGIVILAIFVSYSMTVLPIFWNVLLRHIDNRIKEEVRTYFDLELQRRRAELEFLEEEVRKRKETIDLLQTMVGKKLEKERLSPIGGGFTLRPIERG